MFSSKIEKTSYAVYNETLGDFVYKTNIYSDIVSTTNKLSEARLMQRGKADSIVEIYKENHWVVIEITESVVRTPTVGFSALSSDECESVYSEENNEGW